MNFAPIYKKREILCLTLVHGIETLVVAPSPLGHSSKASSPCSRKEIRERQGSLAQLEVMAMKKQSASRSSFFIARAALGVVLLLFGLSIGLLAQGA